MSDNQDPAQGGKGPEAPRERGRQEMGILRKQSTEVLWPSTSLAGSAIPNGKRGDETLLLTPRGARAANEFSSKRRHSGSRGGGGSLRKSPLAEEWRRPESPQSARRARKSSSSPSVPVPRAWSSLVLQDMANAEGGTQVLPKSSRREATGTESSTLAEMRVNYENLKRINKELMAENSKLKSFIPPPRNLPQTTETGLMQLQSPSRRGETRRKEESFGSGDPESEKILEAESRAGDDGEVARTKMAMRQIMSVSTLIKSLNETLSEDKQIVAKLLEEADRNREQLREAEKRIEELEAELASIKGGEA